MLEDYSARNNRWAREADAGLHDDAFWRTMYIANATRAPTAHLQHWFQSDKVQMAAPTKIVEFACSKASSIALEWDLLLDDAHRYEAWAPLLDSLGDDIAPEWIAKAVLATLEIRSDYHRRVLHKMRTFPYLLLWLVWTPPDVPCNERKACVANLLELPASAIKDVTTIKIRALFKSSLQ